MCDAATLLRQTQIVKTHMSDALAKGFKDLDIKAEFGEGDADGGTSPSPSTAQTEQPGAKAVEAAMMQNVIYQSDAGLSGA